MEFFSSEIFMVYLLPVVIFFTRILDVTIGTIRIIALSKGMKNIAPILGFFEVLIWILVIGKIMQNVTDIYCYIAYAAGFAAGNYIGMKIEEKVALGYIVLRIITGKPAFELIEKLNEKGFGATYIDAHGTQGKVNIVYSIIRRNSVNEIVGYIKTFNPKAFYTFEDVKSVSYGTFPRSESRKLNIFANRRQGK